jgi:hypothetical protein
MLWSGSPPQIVITGLDPVINALSGADGASSAAWMAGSSQIESGHDNYWRIARGDWVGAPPRALPYRRLVVFPDRVPGAFSERDNDRCSAGSCSAPGQE